MIQESIPKRQEDYPYRLTVDHIGEIMDVGRKTAYQIIKREDFPKVKMGNRFIIPRDRFFSWYNNEFIDGN